MRFKTLSIHAGQAPDPLHGAVMPPVYQTSTFAFEDPEHSGEFDYSRSGNPTRKALEECLAALEHGARGLAFASGMAAEATILALYGAGDHLIASDEMYGGTYRLLMNVVASKGVEVELVNLGDLHAVEAALRPNTRALWIETPTNPLMKVVDLAGLVALAQPRGIHTICDNTFLSPYFQNPLDIGVDIVCHSTTKYLNGHSDVIGGGVVAREAELGQKLYFLQNAIGAVPGPWDCFLVLRGIKTLALRMEEHQRNGLRVAEYLEAHPKVERVLHPGLPSHPQYDLARQQSRGSSGMFSFFLKGGKAEAHAFLGHLNLFSQAVSLGGVESLSCFPWSMTHAAVPEPARIAMGITQNLVRLSIGLEDVEDLLEDVEQALSHV